jgi:HlyD family secretion protein
VEQAKANLLAAQAGMARAKANLLEAKRTMERNRKLLSGNLISRSDMDTSETKYEIAKTAVATAGAQIVQAKAGLQYAETNLKYTRILSPVKGIVISRNVDVGQTVAASFQTPTLFSIAGNLAKMQIDTNVDEADIGNIKVGEDVAFTVEAYPNLKFKGRVWQVRNAPIVIQNVVTYDAVIRVNNPGLKLKPGMTASVSITTLRKKNVLRIPNAALRFVPMGENASMTLQKAYGVWIIKKKKLKRITVKIGISDANYTELLSGNLKAGQKVMVESLTEQHKSGGRGIF